MRSHQAGCRRLRAATEFLLGSILAFTLVSPGAAQQGNRVAEGEAAAVGQPTPGHSSRPPRTKQDENVQSVDSISDRQQLELRKLRFEKMKQDAHQLAEMAKALEDEIGKSNQNILAVGVPEKAKKIQKLAGKIRSESQY